MTIQRIDDDEARSAGNTGSRRDLRLARLRVQDHRFALAGNHRSTRHAGVQGTERRKVSQQPGFDRFPPRLQARKPIRMTTEQERPHIAGSVRPIMTVRLLISGGRRVRVAMLFKLRLSCRRDCRCGVRLGAWDDPVASRLGASGEWGQGPCLMIEVHRLHLTDITPAPNLPWTRPTFPVFGYLIAHPTGPIVIDTEVGTNNPLID